MRDSLNAMKGMLALLVLDYLFWHAGLDRPSLFEQASTGEGLFAGGIVDEWDEYWPDAMVMRYEQTQ